MMEPHTQQMVGAFLFGFGCGCWFVILAVKYFGGVIK